MSQPMAYEFKHTHRVEFAETDMAGIVHFSNYFRMMEDDATVGWPRVSATCDYRSPLRFEEEVEIHLIVAEVRSRSIRYQFIFRKVGDGLEVARGSVAAVCASVEKTTGKLVPVLIPDRIRARITAAPPEMLRPPVAA